VRVVILPDADALAAAAAELVRERVRQRPDLVLAAPAGRTPRGMYAHLRARQAHDPVEYARLRLFAVDELCPPAPRDGFFWGQIRREFLDWARVPATRCSPFRVDAADLDAMCRAYEAAIAASGGLDLVVLGLGPNGHLAFNEPGSPFDSRTRPVTLRPETVAYTATDAVNLEAAGGCVADRAVTLGLATLREAREVMVLVSGEAKREALRRFLDGPVGPAVPATALRDHPRCTVLADRAARP
jgi:glucosamine-6-phosphate deaminase